MGLPYFPDIWAWALSSVQWWSFWICSRLKGHGRTNCGPSSAQSTRSCNMQKGDRAQCRKVFLTKLCKLKVGWRFR